MTTATYALPWAHTSTAAFLAWGSKLSATMQACGLQQTTDTGQINWTTATIPTVANTSAGYEIYEFTDTLQATSPIFLKIEYGTGANGTTTPSLWVTVGTGSNGSGTLTGTVSTRTQIIGAGTADVIYSYTTPYPTYVCFNGSYLGVVHKINSFGFSGDGYIHAGGTFMVGRGTNTSGAYVAGQIVFICNVVNNSQTVMQATMYCMNTITNTIYSCTNGTFACMWFSPTTTAVGQSTFQLYPVWGAFNQVEPINWLLYGLNTEITQGTTVTATPFGSTQHTYLMTGTATQGWGVNSNANCSILMLWE